MEFQRKRPAAAESPPGKKEGSLVRGTLLSRCKIRRRTAFYNASVVSGQRCVYSISLSLDTFLNSRDAARTGRMI
jgi:hypothetical protein